MSPTPEEVHRRLVAEFPVYRAANARIALWAVLYVALRARAADERAAFVAVDESDQDTSGALVACAVLDADGVTLPDASEAVTEDDDVGDALLCLDTSNRPTWGDYAVDDGSGRNVRLDIGRVLEEVAVGAVYAAHPPIWPLAEGEEVLEVAFSTGLTGTKDWGAGAWYFALDASVADAEAALRAAVAEYLAGPDANPNGYAFNWGDAIDEVPDDVWARQGLRPLDLPVARYLDVDHDETFAEAEESA